MDKGYDMTSGLLDTSVVIDWHDPAVIEALPDEAAVSAVSLAELAAGSHLASTATERAKRQARLQEVESMFEPIPLDAVAARSYGLVVAATTAAGRTDRSRVADLLIAATAHANNLDLYTRNPDDFTGIAGLITIIGI
ncbi:MAG: type II toxin-antitoxin system VapC family toxin [Actinomycetota bacterium]